MFYVLKMLIALVIMLCRDVIHCSRFFKTVHIKRKKNFENLQNLGKWKPSPAAAIKFGGRQHCQNTTQAMQCKARKC